MHVESVKTFRCRRGFAAEILAGNEKRAGEAS
jgi:hypothetical protein